MARVNAGLTRLCAICFPGGEISFSDGALSAPDCPISPAQLAHLIRSVRATRPCSVWPLRQLDLALRRWPGPGDGDGADSYLGGCSALAGELRLLPEATPLSLSFVGDGGGETAVWVQQVGSPGSRDLRCGMPRL
jgi:hypothetical protein